MVATLEAIGNRLGLKTGGATVDRIVGDTLVSGRQPSDLGEGKSIHISRQTEISHRDRETSKLPVVAFPISRLSCQSTWFSNRETCILNVARRDKR